MAFLKILPTRLFRPKPPILDIVDISHLSFWPEFSSAKRRKPVFFGNFVSGFGKLLEIRGGFLKENFGG